MPAEPGRCFGKCSLLRLVFDPVLSLRPYPFFLYPHFHVEFRKNRSQPRSATTMPPSRTHTRTSAPLSRAPPPLLSDFFTPRNHCRPRPIGPNFSWVNLHFPPPWSRSPSKSTSPGARRRLLKSGGGSGGPADVDSPADNLEVEIFVSNSFLREQRKCSKFLFAAKFFVNLVTEPLLFFLKSIELATQIFFFSLTLSP